MPEPLELGDQPPITRPPVDRRLLRASPPLRRAMALSVALGILAAAGTLLQAVALGSLLGTVFDTRGAVLSHADLWWFALGVSLSALAALFGPGATTRAATAATGPLRRESLEVTLDPPHQWSTTTSRSALTTLLTRGVDATTLYLATYLPALVLAAVAPLLLLAWLAWADPLSALIVASTVVVLPIFMVLLGKEASAKMRATWAETSRLSGHFGDVLRGMRTLRSFNRSGRQLEVLTEMSEQLTSTTMRTLRVALLSSFALELLSSIATALVAIALGLRLLGGHVGLATALGVLIVTPEVYLPLRRASARYHDAIDGVGAATALVDLAAARLERSPSHRGDAVLDDLAAGRAPRVTFDEVALAHERQDVFARPLSFELVAGSHLGVLGPSGAGKTTVLRLVLGVEQPTAGSVLIDGVPLGELDQRRWRRHLGWLAQHPTLPGATLRELLALRAPATTDDELLALLDEVGLAPLLVRDRALLDAPATGLLRQLSVGERHRLAAVRTVLGRPRLLLLDEPLAHLDAVSAQRIAALVSTRWGGASAIVATHEAPASIDLDLLVEVPVPEVLGAH